MLKILHLWVGIISLIAFVLTGQYFIVEYGGLENTDNVTRLMYRSVHVYLFFAAALNLALGFYYTPPTKRLWLAAYNQALILLSPALLLYSFCFEITDNEELSRPATLIATVMILAWISNMLIGRSYLLCQKLLLSKQKATGN